MKHGVIAYIASFILGIYPCFAGGIPVIDTSNLAQQIVQVQHMVQQIEQLQQQISLADQKLKSISGVRGMGNLIDAAYDQVIAVNPQPLLQAANIKNAQQMGLTGDLATLYETQNTQSATLLAQSQKSLQQAKDRFHGLHILLEKVNDSPEQKDILDLQARIDMEQAFLQNEMIKLTMLQSEAAAKKALQAQKIQQLRLESGGTLSDFPALND